MRESFSFFFKQVYLFKVNLFVKEANSLSQCFSPFLGTGHYLSPGGGGGSEDFGLNTMKFSRSPH